ncbi:hypothetical protein SAMN04488691_11921 [Haloferax larsenii]|uniref:Phosphoribosyltransferase domain-containing protein n=2 Tax=Haloferax larsenii TaxID=302484 RepID=A0A1H7VC67_HALLR|nr:hypothetical protein SAMN04488691_11921 [Haloferax larsenii]
MRNTFRCPDCNRHLPIFMQATERKCRDCSEVLQQNSKKRRGNSLDGGSASSTSPESEDTSNADPPVISVRDSSDSDSDPEETNDDSSYNLPSVDYPAENPPVQIYYQPTIPEGFPGLTPCHIFGLGEYRSKRKGRNEFSSKLIDFAKEDDLSKFEYFAPHVDWFIENRFDGDISPDLVTVYPGHHGGYSDALVKVCKELESNYDIVYRELLSRAEHRPQQKNYNKNKERWENQDGSISTTRSLSGETVLLLDDVTTSGASVTVGKNELEDAGANQAIGLCLGISKRSRSIYGTV